VNCGASVAESSLLLSSISLVMITSPPIATMSPQGKRSAGVPMADGLSECVSLDACHGRKPLPTARARSQLATRQAGALGPRFPWHVVGPCA
jgi:hypothetical protein